MSNTDLFGNFTMKKKILVEILKINTYCIINTNGKKSQYFIALFTF